MCKTQSTKSPFLTTLKVKFIFHVPFLITSKQIKEAKNSVYPKICEDGKFTPFASNRNV